MIEWEWEPTYDSERWTLIRAGGIAVLAVGFALFVWSRASVAIGAMAAGAVVGATVVVLDEHVSIPALSSLFADRSSTVRSALLFSVLLVLSLLDAYRRTAEALGASEAQALGFMLGTLTGMAIVFLTYVAYAWQAGRERPA